jgi:uncharacterized protein (TIGR02246 family)
MRATLTLLLFVLLSACATWPNSVQTCTQQVSEATQTWRAAYNSRDPALIVSMYAPDAVFWGTTMKTIATNPVAVAEYFKDARSRPDARVVFGEQHIRVYGDLAVSSGTYTFKDVRDGQEISNPSRYSMVFRKKDGKWSIIDHHSSRVPQ